MSTLSRLFSVVLNSLLIVLPTLASSSSSSISSSSSSPPRPPFLSHVTRETLLDALAVAKQRHAQAVQQALHHFPTDQNKPEPNHRVDPATFRWRDYIIDAPGALPDHVHALSPRRVRVTHSATPLLTPEECQHVIQLAEDHFVATNQGQWTLQQSGQYQVAGFYIKDIPAVREWFVRTVQSKLFPLLAHTFPEFCYGHDDRSDEEHYNDNNNDPCDLLCVDHAYLFKYTVETGRRTDVHTDSGCLSFTLALNGPDDYTGGGTWLEGLTATDEKEHLDTSTTTSNNNNENNNVIHMGTGQVTLRPGGVKHCGYAVQSGTRYIIGGFCLHRHRDEPVRLLLSSASAEPSPSRRLQWLEAAVVLNPACESGYSLLANELEQQGQVEAAKQVLEYCLQQVHPRSGDVAYSLGSIYLKQHEYARAKACFEICLQADEYDVDAMRGLAETCAALQQPDEEERYYRRLVATPGASDASVAAAYCNLGVLAAGRPEEIELYQTSLSLQPDAFAARYSLACALASQNRHEEAVEEFRTALRHAANDQHADHALQGLYMSTANLVQQDASSSTLSREDMIQKFQEIMGVENYQQLAANATRKRTLANP